MAGVPFLNSLCATVYAERLNRAAALSRSAAQFAAGGSLITAYYNSGRARAHIHNLAQTVRLSATLAYSCAVAPLAPKRIPTVLDLVDVDSEKWNQYARTRSPAFSYEWEAQRLRAAESRYSRAAAAVLLSTEAETALFRTIEPQARLHCVENGVDADYFDPDRTETLPHLRNRRFLLFTGAMDYYPNRSAVSRFATEILPQLRQNDPGLEFLIVGRDPAADVLKLRREPGVTVTGEVEDIRPYLSAAWASVAPLDIARGIQNKVIEALAMGRTVFGSSAICRTFGTRLPTGLVPCDSNATFIRTILAGHCLDPALVRRSCRERFSWTRNMRSLSNLIEACAAPERVLVAAP